MPEEKVEDPAVVRQPDDQVPDDADSQPDLPWRLGFVEPDDPLPPAQLLRHRFPNKVGGRPAWLNPLDLPPKELLLCPATSKPMAFLVQIYATLPMELDGTRPDAFHRSLFVFISMDARGLLMEGGVRAFRCQLPRDNAFYSAHPPTDADTLPAPLSLELETACLARDPWRVVAAEKVLGRFSQGSQHAGSEDPSVASAAPLDAGLQLLPEMDVIIGDEDEDDDLEEQAGQEALARYQEQLRSEGGELTEEELPPEVVQQVEQQLGLEERQYAAFAAVVAKHPGQILRYCFHKDAAPLWPAPHPVQDVASVPPCPRCGAPRQFEVQIMPQLVHFLALDPGDPSSPDWGTIAVFTCSKSCYPPAAYSTRGGTSTPQELCRAYAEEYVFVQPPDAPMDA